MSHTKNTQKAGWATCEITPPLGLPMGGRGARFSPGQEILAPLLAQAVVLEDAQGSIAVLLSVDLIELPEQVIRPLADDIASLVGTHPAKVLINASHTHSGPMMGFWRYATSRDCPENLASYIHSLHGTLLKLARDAANARKPVNVTWHQGSTHIGINRRKLVDGQMIMAPNETAPYDDKLWVLDIQSTQNAADRCILFSNACHPVMVYGFAWNAISSEWPGQARLALQKQLGQDTHCQFFQGFAGNIRPRILAEIDKSSFRKAAPEDVAAVGQTIASDIITTLDTHQGDALSLDIQGQSQTFIARKDTSKLPPRSHWESLLDSDQEHLREGARYWLARMGEDGVPPYISTPWYVGLLCLTPQHAIAWMGGEPVIEWRSIIQHAIPSYKLVTWGYTQYHAGYLAVDKLLPEGGYEVSGYPMLGNQSPVQFLPGLDTACTKAFRVIHASIAASQA